MAKKKIKRKIFTGIAIVVVLAGLLALLFSGDNKKIIIDLFNGDASLESILQDVQSLGWQGMVVFGVLSMLQVVLTFLPAEPVQVLAGISYGLWVGVAICAVGVIVGNTVIYILYRVYGDKLREYFQKKIEVDFDVLASSKRVTLIIFILYFLPAIPYGLICFFAASIGMKYHKYIITTVLGAIPSIFIGVGLGHLAINQSWIVSVCVFAVLVIVLIIMYCKRNALFAKLNEFAKKSFGYSSKTQVREPNSALSSVVYGGMRTYLKSNFKCKFKNNVEKIERPSIVLCNHGAFVDFLYFSMFLKKDKPHVVSNRQYFYGKTLGNLLKRLGCIPKSMFTSDIENVKNCLHVVKNNGVLVICPEARLSTAGKFEDIQPSTMNFLRKMNVAIYTIKFGGDYLAMPKWARKNNKRFKRRGALIEAEMNLLYKAGESMTVSEEEFSKTVTEVLDYNDFDWLKQHPEVHYKAKNLAVGLENILYRCPKCNKEFTLNSRGNALICSECGFVAEMDDRYGYDADAVGFANLQEWYDWQADVLKKQIDGDEQFELRDEVTLKHSSLNGKTQLRDAGQGVCVLNRQGLTYTGTDSGEEIVKFFPISKIYRILFGADEDFELYDGQEIWYFVPQDKRTCVKWYIASIILVDGK